MNNRFQPSNEQGVVFLFAQEVHRSSWMLHEIGTGFPDAIVEKDGEVWRAEFEYTASNFVVHGHDIRGCDLIICWKNDYGDCVLPIIELSNPYWFNVDFDKCDPMKAEREYRRQQDIEKSRKIERENRPQQNMHERRRLILEILQTEGHVGVSEMTRRLSASSRGVVNNDMKVFRQQGIIIKTKNGWELVQR